MVDKNGDEVFAREFLQRAVKRQEKIESELLQSAAIKESDVSYPALSPLQEEDGDVSPDAEEEGEISRVEDRGENASPEPASPGLNYSSDLSLECNTDEVYRADYVVCHSSPTRTIQPPIQPLRHQISPRKQVATAPQQPQQECPERSVPLQEIQAEKKPTSSHSLPGTTPTEQALKDLEQKAKGAEQTRGQLQKVVELSKYGSKEHIEAARLLQIAEFEHLGYNNYISLFKGGHRKRTEGLGSITIKDIRLKIGSKLRNDLADDGVSHHFFCIAACATDVKATEIIDTGKIRQQDLKHYLHFKDKMEFTQLPPDFAVRFEVFELVIGQHMPKLLSRLTPSKKTKITPESRFRRVGSMRLTLSDREVKSKNLTHWSRAEESKYIERECRFEIELKPEQLPCKTGMLHVRGLDSMGRPDWSRFWVNLSCGQIRFWSFKQDALDDKMSDRNLEFYTLCSDKVQKLTPDDDLYRQNSFVLYSYHQVTSAEKDTLFQRILKEDPKSKVVKHQFAAENREERDAWCAILDRSMQCFREWYGESRVYTVEEVKTIFSS